MTFNGYGVWAIYKFEMARAIRTLWTVLDEMDAALDESNIQRFITILKGFMHQSQFVLITHNRQTIGTADIIYGVTMEESKVSRIVSMRFNKDGRPTPVNGNGKPEPGSLAPASAPS